MRFRDLSPLPIHPAPSARVTDLHRHTQLLWGARDHTWALTLVQQVLYGLTHLPSPSCENFAWMLS